MPRNPAELFQTERLDIRTWRAEDFATLKTILSDPVTMAHWPAPLTDEQVEGWLIRAIDSQKRDGLSRWCVELRSTGEVVGDVGIVRAQVRGRNVWDLGYIIHHPFWRQGYALEAARGAIDHAAALGVEEVVATMAVDNEASSALAENLGMQRIETFTNPNNLNKETYLYRLGIP